MNMKNLRLYSILFLSLFFISIATAQVDKQKRLEEQRQALLNEITQINQLLFNAKKEEKSIVTKVENLDNSISTRSNLIRVTNQQANLLTREISNNQNKIKLLREELKGLKEDYAAMISKSYRSKSQQSKIMFLFSSQNFLQAYKRLQYINQYTKHRKKQGVQIQDMTLALQTINTDLLSQKKIKKQLIAANKIEKQRLSKQQEEQKELIASLKKDENSYARQIRNKQKQANKIDKQIDALIAAAIAASNKASGVKTTTKKSSKTFALTAEAKALAASFTSNKGKLPWPVKNGVVIKRFGKQQHPQLPNVTTFNSGVVIATQNNAKARAVFKGTVIEIQLVKGANKAILIQHGNYITVYNNMATVLVKKGDTVTTKQEIGTVFTNPSSGKTEFKFLIYKNTNRMNPAEWVFKM